MGIQRKTFRYEMKKQENAAKGKLAKAADRLKVLRSVLAAGFAVLPFFATEAFAAGEITRVNDSNNLMQNGKADIYAESVSGNVGLNRFQSFKVEKNELANLYFRTKDNANALNTLVNTVNDRIDINGTVNAIRNNKVGGNLYFLSPKGMVVGAGGAINAGSLTVMTAENSFKNAKEAQDALSNNDWKLNTKSSIDIYGKLNAATGIDLRAAYINVKKEKEDAEAPLLRTGLLFNTTVNTDGLVDKVTIADGRLTAVVDSNTKKIVIADPNDATNEKLKGDGSINLKAEAADKNASHELWGATAFENAVEAGVEVGNGAEIDALGDVNISATATYDNQKFTVEVWDFSAFAKADVKVDGNVKGRNVNLKAEATSSLNSDNIKNIFDMVDRGAEFITVNGKPISINDALTDSLENLFIDRGFLKKGTSYFDTINNIVEQLYMPFGYVEADATVSQGAASQIIAQNNLTAVAKSTATNNFSVAIQPKLKSGDFNVSKYFSGGFMYVDTDSNATVDIGGTMQAGGNMTLNAAAINTSISSLVVKPPRTFENPDSGKDDGKKDDTSSGTGDDTTNKQSSGADAGNADKDSAGNDSGTTGKDDSGNKKDDNGMQYAAVAITINSQDGQATVNLGSADSSADKSSPKLKAGGALNITATNVNTVVSNAIVAETENTLLNTAINVADSNGKATINANAGLEGASVQLNSNNEMKKLSMNTDGSNGPELSGTAWAVNTPYAKHGMDVLSNFIKDLHQGDKAQEAAGQKKKEGKKATPTKVKSDDWRDAFNVGMSLGIALVDNKAVTNVAAGVPITATGGDIGLGAKVTIDDTQLVTNSLLNLAMRDEYLGAVTAVSIQDMDNSAEVNIAADDKAAVDKSDLQAKGNIKLNAEVDNSYKRLDNLVQAVKDGWESFEATYDKDNADQSVRDAVQSVEGIVADILTMFNRNSATNFSQNKQFAMKSKAALDIITQIEKAFGADELVAALKNIVKASSYANMYVSASTDKMIKMNPDVTAMVTGAFGMQDLNNTAKVNVGANRSLSAGGAVDIDAVTMEQNALLAGKWQLIPDLFTTDAGQNGLGGTVGVQTASNNSEVIINNGVIIEAGTGDIALNTKNDVINTSLVMGGAWTSSLGVTGMVNYVGGESNAKTLVDDDVKFSAHKKMIMGADNDTVLTAVAGDFGYSNSSSIGASVSVIDYDVKTLAQLRNLEESDTQGKGAIVASGVDVSAHTDGIINSFALAGSVSKSANENKDKGGTETATQDGKAQDGVEKAEAKAEDKKTDDAAKDDTSNADKDNKKDDTANTDKDDKTDNTTKNDNVKSLLKDTAGTDNAGSGTATPTPSEKTKDSIIKVDAAGSVAWNYVNDETDASIDGVNIELGRFDSADRTTGVSLKSEDSSYIGAYSGAAALSKFGYAEEAVNATKAQGMLTGAVAVNDLYKKTTGRLNNLEIWQPGYILNSNDRVTSLVQNTGAQVAAGLAMGVELGKKAGGVDINLGGSGSANYVDSTVQAEMTNNEIGPYFHVNNIAYDKDIQVGGGINFEFARGNAAAGAAISINDVDNKIKAVMQGNKIGKIGYQESAYDVNNLALSNLIQVGTATSIGVLVGSGKSFLMGDVAVAVNMLDNDVQAVADGNRINAASFTNEAHDGKLNVSEVQNQYITAINSVNNNGILVEESTGKFYTLDEQGKTHYIVREGDKFVDDKGQEVDISAPAAKEILDLDASAALANANGASGVAFGTTKNENGDIEYTSENITVDNTGNVIVGGAIGVAVKVGGDMSNVTAAVATNVNHINNSFKADTTGNTIKASGDVKINAESDTLMVAVAAGAAATGSEGSMTVDAAGSGVDNTLHNDTIASVTDSNITAAKLEITSSTGSDLISVAGQLSATITNMYSAPIGLTWAQNNLANTTGAYARGLTLAGAAADAAGLNVTAENDSSILTVSAGVGAAFGTGVAAGAYAGSYGKNDTQALVEKSSNNSNKLSNASSINISSTDTSDITTVAGTLELSGGTSIGVTVGGAVANTQLGRNVQSALNDTEATLQSAAEVGVTAKDTASTLNLALGGGVAAAGGSGAISAQGTVAVVNADGATTATVNNTSLIDKLNKAKLNVVADSDIDITMSADFLAAGASAQAGGAAGGAVSVLVNSRDTLAQADGGSWQVDEAAVKATSNTKLENITTGVTASGGEYGALSVTASVQVNDFDGLTEATVNNVKGSVSSLNVNAVKGTDITAYNNGFDFTVAAGSASVGAGVTVIDDKSHTLAGLINSELEKAGSKAGSVAVHASNTTDVSTEVSSNNVSVSIGGAIGTGVQVANLEAQASALVENSTVGSANQRFKDFDVKAVNKATNSFINDVNNISSAGSIAVGVGVVNMNTQTTAAVEGSKAYAESVHITADEERNAMAKLVVAEIGGVAVGVNIMNTNLGGKLEDAYTYQVWNEKKQSYDTYKTYTKATDNVDEHYVTDIQGIAGEALGHANAGLGQLKGNAVPDFTLNKGSGDGKVAVKAANSTLDASNELKLEAKGTNNVDNNIGGGFVAGGSVSVPENLTTVKENQSLELNNSVLRGRSINITSGDFGSLQHQMEQVSLGAAQYSDIVSYITHSGENNLQIDKSQLISGDALNITAQNKVEQVNKGWTGNLTGIDLGRLVLEGKDELNVGVQLKDAAKNQLTAKNIRLTAENAAKVKNEIEAGVKVDLVSAHGGSAESRVKGTAELYVGQDNQFNGEKVSLLAKTGAEDGYTTEALNHAVSVSAGGVDINRALTENSMHSKLYLGAAMSGTDSLDVQALNINSTNAYVHSVTVGLLVSSGNNFAKVEEDSEAAITIDAASADLKATSMHILAQNEQNVTAKADGSGSAIYAISPYAAKVVHEADAKTSIDVKGTLTSEKEMTVQALRKENTNLKADALSVTAAGSGDAYVENSSTSDTQVNVKKAALRSGGDMLLAAENNVQLNKADGYSEMLWGQGYADVAVNITSITNNLKQQAKVQLEDSSLISGGAMNIASHNEEDLRANGYVYSVGISAGSDITLTNNITNDGKIEISGSDLKTSAAYKDITMSAADDLKLFTYCLSETPAGILGGADSRLFNTINRTNDIQLIGKTKVYGMHDVNYYAGKKLDGSLSRMDLDSEARNFNGNILPIALNPTLENHVTQHNTLITATDSSSKSVRHTNIYADTGEELVRAQVVNDTMYGTITEEGGYVTEAGGSKTYDKTINNYVDINGSVAAGMDSKINIVIGKHGDIAFFDKNEREALHNKNALSKEELLKKITVSGKPTASGTTEGLTDETAQKLQDGIKLGSADYAQVLLGRYNEINALMSEYASDGKDTAVYLGYKAESERLLNEMLKAGVASEVNGEVIINGNINKDSRLMLDYVELPELSASGGNIVINTADLKSTAKTGSLEANGSPEVNITNNTNLLLKLGAINIDDAGGRLLYNNQALTGTVADDFNTKINNLNKSKDGAAKFKSIKSETGVGGSIAIRGTYDGAPLKYTVVDKGKSIDGEYLPKADILVSGNIYNQNGSISITSENNNITIAGNSATDSVTILGADVALTAGGSITQTYTDGIVNVEYNVEDLYAYEYGLLKENKWNYDNLSNKESADPKNGSVGNSSYIAGGVIYINAADINVNGIIQSGYADYELLLDDSTNKDLKNQAKARIDEIQERYTEGTVIKDSDVKNNPAYQIVEGGAYWDSGDCWDSSSVSCYKYRLSAWYNPSTKKILVQDVNASGGKIYLTGRISSTGGGQLISLDGVSNINIASNMGYEMSLGSLITNDVKGLVSITDTAGYIVKQDNQDINVAKVTEYTNGETKSYYVDRNNNTYDDSTTVFKKYDNTHYYTKSGLRYTWSSGTKNTDYVRYQEDDMDGGWGAWDLEKKENTLKEWSTPDNEIGHGTYNNEERKAGTVIEETNDTSKSHMDYQHTELGGEVITLENEYYYNSGFLGCHKHHVTTWTKSKGSTDTYYASIKADNSIDVKFIGRQADEGVIKVNNVMNGIELTGSVGNRQLYETVDAAGNAAYNLKGIININSGRINSDEGISQTNGSLYGRVISLKSSGDLKNINIAAGDSMYLYMSSWKNGAMADISVANLAGAKGDLYLGAENNKVNTNWGTLDITNTSTSGNIVQLGEVPIVADRINIKTLNGSVSGNDGGAMLIKGGQTPAAGDSLSASVNVTAKGDINLAQYDGDLRVGRIYSQQGDVTLNVAGSVLDALPDNEEAQGSEESRIERWKNIGLIDGGNSELMAAKSRLNQEKSLGEYKAWDKLALLYAFSESIVNPTAAKLDTASKKDPNIIGHNINITAGGSIGQSGETKEILLTGILARDANGNLKNPNAIEELKALGKADATNVSLRTDENGNKIAVIKDVQPLGIQQSEGAAAGKLNIKSTAKGSTRGDIFLQGREEVGSEKIFSGRSNNDLNIDKIITENGRATITSLGAINNLADNMDDINIQAQNLYLTGLRDIGSLNLKLYGQDIAGDGLSAISGGHLSVSQQDDSRLILRNIAADDIDITADKSIVMGTVGAGIVDYYLQTEAGHEMRITSRSGNLGEFAHDADGRLLEDKSSGLRIKNPLTSKDTNIKLTAEKGSVGLDAGAGIEAVKNLEIKAEGDVLLYGGTIGSEKTTVESVNGSIIGYDNDAIESIDVVLTAKKGSVDINRLKASGWLKASGENLYFGSADISNGSVEGIDVVFDAKNGSVNLDYLKASGWLKASGDRLHFSSADIGNAYIRVGQEAIFDRLRTGGTLQAENVRDYLGYDLGDGMSLTLTGGRNHLFDKLFMQGRDFYELNSQRLFAETLLEKAMDYDVHEKLASPHVRPGLLFSRYNLLEEQDEEEEVSI